VQGIRQKSSLSLGKISVLPFFCIHTNSLPNMSSFKDDFKHFRRWLKAPVIRFFGEVKRHSMNLLMPKLKLPQNPKNIPIIINNFNRLGYLSELINWLERAGMTNIIILDNASTYPPLLKYYKTCPHRIIYLGRNAGYMALWESDVFEEFRNDFYVYTDPDVVPTEDCPNDFMDVFLKILAANADVKKVGFSLKIDDLPDFYERKAEVLAMETKYWKRKRSTMAYDAPIDTTFALYRPKAFGDHRRKALRTFPPYIARHLPWYIDSQNLPEEEIFYKKIASDSNSW
jgi:hypothetical protein